LKGISLVIPAWNEAERLPHTLEYYLPALERHGEPFEVIVVVDGSSDGTADVGRSFGDRGVRVLEFPHKLGKGGAVLEGVREARYDSVGYLDADAPVLPTDIDRLLLALDHADCVVASRRHPDSTILRPQPRSRKIASRVWNFLARSLLRLPLRDTQCGAKFFRAPAVKGILKHVGLYNWAFDVALLYHLRRGGYTIREVPVTWRHDDDSKLSMRRAVPVMFASVIGVRMMNLPMFRRGVPDRLVELFRESLGR
jgi:glycosyltransferase involved in cell wall biosynthesis